jgi:glycosyltransferase involved in cell wall biosynthesis
MSRPIRVLELRSVRGTGGGPEKTILLGAARTDASRFAITVCYLRDTRDPIFGIDRAAGQAGVDYVEIPERHSFDWRIWPALRQLVRQRSIDIVHAHEYKTDALAWALARVAPVVPIATVHGWTGSSPRERRVYYPLDKRVLRRLPRAIAVSSEIRAELIRTGIDERRVVTIPNGIDHHRFRRDRTRRPQVRDAIGASSTDLVVGAVGRMERQKRFDVLLTAFAPLVREVPAVRLVLTGDGSLRPSLERQAADLGIASRCTFLGHRNDVADLQNGFDLFVQSSEYEGTPNAVLEAMALETPIVATDAGGTRDIARDGVDALLVPPGSPEALRSAIETCLRNPEAARGRAEAARRRIEGELSFERRMARLEEIYVELAGDRTAHAGSTRNVRQTVGLD